MCLVGDEVLLALVGGVSRGLIQLVLVTHDSLLGLHIDLA
jgi:hypothetical protein